MSLCVIWHLVWVFFASGAGGKSFSGVLVEDVVSYWEIVYECPLIIRVIINDIDQFCLINVFEIFIEKVV